MGAPVQLPRALLHVLGAPCAAAQGGIAPLTRCAWGRPVCAACTHLVILDRGGIELPREAPNDLWSPHGAEWACMAWHDGCTWHVAPACAWRVLRHHLSSEAVRVNVGRHSAQLDLHMRERHARSLSTRMSARTRSEPLTSLTLFFKLESSYSRKMQGGLNLTAKRRAFKLNCSKLAMRVGRL